MIALALGAGLPALAPRPAVAQEQAKPALPVLTLDFERLFETTLWGKRIADDLARDSAALTTENNRIADDLIAEEKSLTERRATLPPDVFRSEATAFDDRTTGIRNAQKAKSQALSQGYESARQGFYTAVAPLMDEVLAGRGAVVVLDRRVIIRGLEAADITDDLARLVDARFGDGTTPETAGPETAAPETAAPETAGPETVIPEAPVPQPPMPGSPAFGGGQ